MRTLLPAVCVILVAVTVACGAGDGAPEAQRTPVPTARVDPPLTPQPTPAPPVFTEPSGLATAPRGDRTGITDLDAAITEIERRDVDAIAARLRFVDLECVEQPELGDPPACADGEPPGTSVAVFVHGLGCHGGYRRDARAAAEELLADELSLHSVVGVDPPAGAPRHELLFVAARDVEGPGFVIISFHLEGSEIVTVTDGCGLAPVDFRANRYLETETAEVILRGPAFPSSAD